MTGYLIRRLLWVPIVLFIVSFVTFALARLGPGDPVSIAAGQYRDPVILEQVKKTKGLDKPIVEQYGIYIKNLVTKADLGQSFKYRDRDVSEIIFPAMWRSIQYNSIALVITLGIGIPLGVFAARRQGTWADPTSIGSFLFLQSIPSLVSVPFLLLIFALKLGWLPASGWPRDCAVSLSFLPTSYQCLGVVSKEAIIPILALSVPAIAFWARYTRATTLSVLGEDYVRTARAKGLGEFEVMTVHVMRNALLPLSTVLGFSLIGLLEGSFFLETLAGIPGSGVLTVQSINNRDYDMIIAITMLGASLFVVMSIAIDIGYTLIDPRVRLGAQS